jgi:hypothetical protein
MELLRARAAGTFDARKGTDMEARLGARIALGRAIRAEAQTVVETRGRLAEAAAWAAARAPGLTESERLFREAVAARVSRMFAFIGTGKRH